VLDVARVEAHAASARAAMQGGDFVRAALAFRDALSEWRGRPFEEFSDHPWAVLEGARLRELHQALLEERVDADLGCGRHAELTAELERMCRAHPLRERLWGQLMLAYYRCGRQAEALRAYQEIRRVLAEELGIDPSPALARLEQQILVQDPSLEPASAAGVHGEAPTAPQPSADPLTPLVPRGPAERFVPTLPDVLAALAFVPFVGRRGELDALEAAASTVRGGRCQLVFVTGEPGIGKTTLVAKTAADALTDGATVLFGRCDEHSLVAFQPFVEAIDHYVAEAPPDQLRAEPGAQAADLALLVPSLARRLPELGQVAGTGAETERYRIFESVTAFLSGLCEGGPLVLVLDDLHWADRPTLGLLQHVVRRSRDASILLIGTYRDTDLVRTQPLSEALVDLRRADLVSRIHLSGLPFEDVQDLVTAGQTPGDADRDLAKALWSETEGSPLFLREILRHLEETGVVRRGDDGRLRAQRRIDQLGIPEGVKEVIGRRLTRLSEPANVALRTGSVIGRELRMDVLEQVCDLSEDQLLDAMDEALAAGVVDEVPGKPGRWSFTHALVRYTLYEELSLSRRVRLHQKVGEALEAIDAGDGPHLAEIAYHFSQAAVSGTAEKAVDYACRAGAFAMRVAAWEQAARHFAGAVEVAEDAGTDTTVVADLLLAQGDAEWRRDAGVARRTFERVISLVGTDDPARLARAALGYAGFGIRGFWVEMFVVNERVLELLETALAALPDEPSALRAQVLACLAREQYFQSGTDDRRRQLVDQALAMARAVGEPEVLAAVLSASVLAVLSPDSGEEVGRHTAEMLALADELDDRELEAAALRFIVTTPTADAEHLFSALQRWEELIDELKDPTAAAFDKLMRGGMAMQRGDFATAERLIAESFRDAHELHDRNAFGAGATIVAWLRQYQGRSAEILGVLAACKDVYPAGSAWADAVGAGGYAELGMADVARSYLDLVDPADPNSLPRNALWIMAVGMYARACFRLGEVERADVAYELLRPYGDIWGLVACMGQGSLHLPIAWAAWASGRRAEAREHFEAALVMNRSWGWRAAVAETQLHYARFLAESPAPDDTARARELATASLEASEEMGMRPVAGEARALLSAIAGDGAHAPESVIERHGNAPGGRRSGRRARFLAGGRAAVARWTAGESDEALYRRFSSSLAQRALFVAVGRAFRPESAFGFRGDLVVELRPPDDELDPTAADWWTIEIRGRKATGRRGRSGSPAVTLHLNLATFIRIVSGELHPVRAVIENRAEVEGDFVLAARLADMFGAIDPAETPAPAAAAN
jgi:predicted ATPase